MASDSHLTLVLKQGGILKGSDIAHYLFRKVGHANFSDVLSLKGQIVEAFYDLPEGRIRVA
jgi:hypothetical protein